jgi:hypothetical protein
VNSLKKELNIGKGGYSVQSSLSRTKQVVMGKTTRQVQQMSPLYPYEHCVQKTCKGDSNHTDKGWPSKLIRTREDHGGDIRADLK